MDEKDGDDWNIKEDQLVRVLKEVTGVHKMNRPWETMNYETLDFIWCIPLTSPKTVSASQDW